MGERATLTWIVVIALVLGLAGYFDVLIDRVASSPKAPAMQNTAPDNLVSSGPVQSASLSDTQKKELTVFGMKAMGINVSISQVKKVLSTPDVYEMVATGLNLNGHLCAELVSISSLKVKSTYEATCIAYRGGSSQKSYIVDALKGVAFIP